MVKNLDISRWLDLHLKYLSKSPKTYVWECFWILLLWERARLRAGRQQRWLEKCNCFVIFIISREKDTIFARAITRTSMQCALIDFSDQGDSFWLLDCKCNSKTNFSKLVGVRPWLQLQHNPFRFKEESLMNATFLFSNNATPLFEFFFPFFKTFDANFHREPKS